jgi:hypothetical protein
VSVWYVIGAPLLTVAVVWLYSTQEGAPAWQRHATNAIALGLAVAVGSWLN